VTARGANTSWAAWNVASGVTASPRAVIAGPSRPSPKPAYDLGPQRVVLGRGHPPQRDLRDHGHAARVLGVPEGTAKSRARLALAKLGALLDPRLLDS
jgi:hypothetical protein